MPAKLREPDDTVAVASTRTLEEAVFERYASAGRTITCAESCTGGALGYALTNPPGASEVFLGGVVSYSYGMKVALLGVRRETLERFGAVSPECAREMVTGCRERLGGGTQIAITGIAGPGGGRAEKPVGLVYIAECNDGRVELFEFRFSGNRRVVRAKSVEAALLLLLRPGQLSLSELLERIEGRLLTAP